MSEVARKPRHADAAHRSGVAERRADYECELPVDERCNGTLEGFDVVALGDVAHLEMGQSPDSRYVSDDMGVGVPFLQGNAEFGASSPQPRFSCTQPAKMCREGDLLISVRAPVGEINLADRDYCIGRGLAAVRLHGMPASLAAQAVIAATPSLRRVAQGTTFDAISKSDLSSLAVQLPPAREREVLARIVDTLDTTIRHTEAIIAKLKQVKQGLLHDLLTRGIDANGELRPPQSEAPHLYKPSTLGWIPVDWAIDRLDDLLTDDDPAMRSGPFGSALLKGELVDAGIPLLGIDNVHVERFSTDYQRFVTPKKFSELSRYAVRPEDLMITIMGTVGRCCLVPETIGPALSSKHTWTVSLDQSRYSPYLAMLQVNYSQWVLDHFAKDQQGGTMAAIRSETLRALRFPTPPRDEQCWIEKHMREIGRTIELEIESVLKLRLEKAGLMDDLLTGRVRVTPLLQAETAAP